MKKKKFTRIISKIIYKDGYTVQSYNYSDYIKLGSLEKTIKYLNDWETDEIIFINLSSENNFKNIQNGLKNNFIPITYGGQVSKLDTYKWAINNGFEKVSFNSLAYDGHFDLIEKCSLIGGVQSIVLCLDILINGNKYLLFNYKNKNTKNIDIEDLTFLSKKNLFSEILINITNQDGKTNGINNFRFFKQLQKNIDIPVLASCGLFTKEQYIDFLANTNCIPVLGNILMHYENPIASIRHILVEKGYTNRIHYDFKGTSR